MTEEELDAIETRANAATPGPWELVSRDGDSARRKLWGAADQMVLGLAALLYPDPPDEEFITHARTDIPALVAEIRRLRQETR